jgi:sulfur-carrier protein
MEVNVKLFATLREGRFKEQKIDVRDTSRVIDVIDSYAIPKEDIAICFVNGRHADKQQTLKNGDTIALFPPVGGG